MNIDQSVFLEKTFLKILVKKSGFGVILFTLFHQSNDSKNYLTKFRLYMPQICGVAKKI